MTRICVLFVFAVCTWNTTIAQIAGKIGNEDLTVAIVLRINNPHHMGGMFRRPFL